MDDCELLRRKLFSHYGDTIICRVGEGAPTYNATEINRDLADMAIYIHKKYKTAIVWNIRSRRKNNRMIHSYSISKSWEDIRQGIDEMDCLYKKMGSDSGAPYEKVLLLGIEALEHNIAVLSYSCAPRRRATNLTGGKPVCEGLTNQQ